MSADRRFYEACQRVELYDPEFAARQRLSYRDEFKPVYGGAAIRLWGFGGWV